MEAGRARDGVGVLSKPDTALSEAGFEGVDVGEGLVGSDLPQQRPEMLSGVEFRRIGRQESEPEISRYGELGRAVPGSTVKHKQSDDVYGQ